MKPTKKDVESVIQELKEAMMESIEASEAEDRAKQRKMKAQKRLTMARDAVRSLSIN